MASQSSARDIKSTAIVKFAAVETPTLQKLLPDTDLKQPPANWLHGQTKLEDKLPNVTFSRDQAFSSFKLGHSYPDLTGEIDVVSDSENIKKLLKMPYNRSGHVSMMVHRVANTLLLDDFDIHKHLLRQQQTDWQWLRRFYYETVVENMRQTVKDKMHVIKKNKSRHHLQNMNMFSKFLYYSVGETDGEATDSESCHLGAAETLGHTPTSVLNTIPDPLPQMENYAPEQQRSYLWTFEDIRMLIGTDLPIFGGKTHPCISLRLREQHTPINVLTGLDYWLDNLMCNVPEMAMCYHLDGIVQSYELIKKEDIPKISDSEFSPTVVKDIAQNILSFLKANATKEGHTYWLFKGHDDDIVKLYDLTTLCTDIESQKDQEYNRNPFVIPVGMLLYRVARNMRQNTGRHKSGTIRTLLNNCLLLLDKESYPQVVTSAQLLLSDLYISDNIYRMESTPDTSDESDTEEENQQPETTDDIDDATSKSIDVQALCVADALSQSDKSNKEVVRYPPVSGNVEERCREALKHIVKGLACLDDSIRNAGKTSESKDEPVPANEKHKVEEQQRCNPSKPIPLSYQPIKPQFTEAANSSRDKKSPESDSTNQMTVYRGSLPQGSWQKRSKCLLVRKSAIAYYGLADTMLGVEKYGAAWKYIRLGLHCFRVLESICSDTATSNQALLSGLLSLSGDLHLTLARQPDLLPDHRADMEVSDWLDCAILSSIKLEGTEQDEWYFPVSVSVQDNLERSCTSYQMCVEGMEDGADTTEHGVNRIKRYGNVLNELGVYYMNQSASLLNDSPDSKMHNKLRLSSAHCFRCGIEQFGRLRDGVNMALLHSNLGRLYRLCAQAVVLEVDTGGGSKREFLPSEAQYFTKAQESYSEALRLLGCRDNHLDVWDSITWELSSTYFTMATLLQDFAPLSTKAQQQVESEVIRLMDKALDLCDVHPDSAHFTSCVYRAGIIHHRMASLNHNAYRNQMDDQHSRQLRQEAERHYTAASQLFLQTDSCCERLRVQLERVALLEFQLNNQTSHQTKVKTLQAALEILASCQTSVHQLIPQVSAPDDHQVETEADKLVTIFVSRLQFVSLNLVKYTAPKGKKTSQSTQNATYKTVYSLILRGTSDTVSDLVTRCQHLSDTLLEIKKIIGGENPSGKSPTKQGQQVKRR